MSRSSEWRGGWPRRFAQPFVGQPAGRVASRHLSLRRGSWQPQRGVETELVQVIWMDLESVKVQSEGSQREETNLA